MFSIILSETCFGYFFFSLKEWLQEPQQEGEGRIFKFPPPRGEKGGEKGAIFKLPLLVGFVTHRYKLLLKMRSLIKIGPIKERSLLQGRVKGMIFFAVISVTGNTSLSRKFVTTLEKWETHV